MNNKTKGFIYGAIAAASYGMNPLFALPLYAAGMSVDTVLFYRYFFAAIVLGILSLFCWHFRVLLCSIKEMVTNRYPRWGSSSYCCLHSHMLYT